jgi:hypothetical protein
VNQDLSTSTTTSIVTIPMSTSDNAATHSERAKVTLTCVQCRQRKRKCDKNSPCGACVLSGSECTAVRRARLPRGRHAASHDGDLRHRVLRLERLLGAQDGDDETTSAGLSHSTPLTSGNFTSSALVNEVVGIRELLDKATEDDEEDDDSPSYESSDNASTFDFMLFGDRSCHIAQETLEPPSSVMSTALLDIYAQRVDPIIKAVHMGTARSRLSSATTNPTQDALTFSIYFAAIGTLNDEECYHCFSKSRDTLSDKFQLAAEVKLSRAGLMTIPTLVVLQAFVVYLVSKQTTLSNIISLMPTRLVIERDMVAKQVVLPPQQLFGLCESLT